MFTRVDYQYPLDFGVLAKDLGVPHYVLLTSSGADPNSMFFYMKTKGNVERETAALDLNLLSLFRPGLIADRGNDFRLHEKIASWIPFLTKITCVHLGEAILLHSIEKATALKQGEAPQEKVLYLSNA